MQLKLRGAGPPSLLVVVWIFDDLGSLSLWLSNHVIEFRITGVLKATFPAWMHRLPAICFHSHESLQRTQIAVQGDTDAQNVAKNVKLGQQGCFENPSRCYVQIVLRTQCYFRHIIKYFLSVCVCSHLLWTSCCVCAAILSSLHAENLSTPWLYVSVILFSSM